MLLNCYVSPPHAPRISIHSGLVLLGGSIAAESTFRAERGGFRARKPVIISSLRDDSKSCLPCVSQVRISGSTSVWIFCMRQFPLLNFDSNCYSTSFSLAVTSKTRDKLILESDAPVLAEFYANWCGPCRMVHRVIDEIANDYSGGLKCFLLDADNDPPIAEKCEIKAVPVVLLFKNGEKREAVMGTMPKDFCVAAFERVMTS